MDTQRWTHDFRGIHHHPHPYAGGPRSSQCSWLQTGNESNYVMATGAGSQAWPAYTVLPSTLFTRNCNG